MSPHHPLKRLTHPSTVIQKHSPSTSYGSHTNIQYCEAKEKDKMTRSVPVRTVKNVCQTKEREKW